VAGKGEEKLVGTANGGAWPAVTYRAHLRNAIGEHS
jgi:hypothetical protein